MFSFKSPQLHLGLLVTLLFFASSCTAFAPNFRVTVYRRQNSTLSGPQTVITTQQIPTASGLFTQTCNITMTPITGNDGESLIEEQKSCAISMDTPGSSSGGTSTGIDPNVSSLTTIIIPASSPGVGASPNGLSTVPLPSAIPSLGGTPGNATSSSPSPGTPTHLPANGASPSVSSSIPPSIIATPAAAAEDSANSGTFTPPGRSLQVLPVGLGIVGGVTAIALVIVGIVTYERTRHRKNFRRRRLAESGAEMGYGGIAKVAA